MLLHYFSDLVTIRKYVKAYDLEMLYLRGANLVSRISNSIYQALHFLYRPSAFMLIRTLLRYSDLITLCKYANVTDDKIFVVQKKTKKIVIIKFEVFTPELRTALNDLCDLPHLVTYSMLCRAIQQKKKCFLPDYLLHCNNGTHLFRHIEASFQAWKGSSLTDISKSLGHSSTEITHTYLHRELYPLF